jgi:hypothetical protein
VQKNSVEKLGAKPPAFLQSFSALKNPKAKNRVEQGVQHDFFVLVRRATHDTIGHYS